MYGVVAQALCMEYGLVAHSSNSKEAGPSQNPPLHV